MSSNFSKPGQYPPGFPSGSLPGFQYSPQLYGPANHSFHASGSNTATVPTLQPQSSQAQEPKAADNLDIEKLRKLKEAILAGQHPYFKAVPNPIALAKLWLGPHPASQAAKDQLPSKSGKIEPNSLTQAPSQSEIKSSVAVDNASVDSSRVNTSASSMTGTGRDAIQSNADPNGTNDSSRLDSSTKQLSVSIPSKPTIEPLSSSVTQTAPLVTSSASGTIPEPNYDLHASDQPPKKPTPDSKDVGVYRVNEHDKDRDRGRERERPGFAPYDSRYDSARYAYPPDRRDSSRDSIRYTPRYNDPRYDRDHDWNRDRAWELKERERERDRLRDRLEFEKSRQTVDKGPLPPSVAVLEPRSTTPLDSPPNNVLPQPEQRLVDHRRQDTPIHASGDHHPNPSSNVERRPGTEPRQEEPILISRSGTIRPIHSELQPPSSTPAPAGRTDKLVGGSVSRPAPSVPEQSNADSVIVGRAQGSERDELQASHAVAVASSKPEHPPERTPGVPVISPTVPAPAEHRATPTEQRPPPLPSTSQPAADTSSAEKRAESTLSTEVASRTADPLDTHLGAPPRPGERDGIRSYYPPSTEPRLAMQRAISPRRPSEPPYEGPRERILSASSVPYHDAVQLSPSGPRTYPEADVRIPLDGVGPHRPDYYPPRPPSPMLDRRPSMGHWRERHGDIPMDDKRGYPVLERNAIGRPPPASWERDRLEYEAWDKQYPPPHHWNPEYDGRFIPREAVRYLPAPELVPREGYADNPRIRPRSPSPPGRPIMYDEAHRAPKRIRDDYDRPPYYDERRAEYPPRPPSPLYYNPRPPMVSRGSSPYGRERVPDPYRRDMPPPRSPPSFYPRERYPAR